MDRNLLLAFALSFLVLSVWTMMQPPPRPKTAPTAQTEAPAPESATQPAPRPAAPAAETAKQSEPTLPAQTIAISRPLYLVELSSEGAALRDWELTQYRDRHGDPVRLASRGDPLATAATPFDEL